MARYEFVWKGKQHKQTLSNSLCLVQTEGLASNGVECPNGRELTSTHHHKSYPTLFLTLRCFFSLSSSFSVWRTSGRSSRCATTSLACATVSCLTHLTCLMSGTSARWVILILNGRSLWFGPSWQGCVCSYWSVECSALPNVLLWDGIFFPNVI